MNTFDNIEYTEGIHGILFPKDIFCPAFSTSNFTEDEYKRQFCVQVRGRWFLKKNSPRKTLKEMWMEEKENRRMLTDEELKAVTKVRELFIEDLEEFETTLAIQVPFCGETNVVVIERYFKREEGVIVHVKVDGNCMTVSFDEKDN